MSVQEKTATPAAEHEVKVITHALAAPFASNEVKWKPQAVKGNRALAVAYVDARVIQDRLDEVLGVEGWQDEYQLLPDNSVICRLRLKLGGRWITKMDVGSPSEQPDGGDRLKAAFSDALKRAAVKFGIGRYLYRLPQQWCDFDPVKKQFMTTPRLPGSALPMTSKRERSEATGPNKHPVPIKDPLPATSGKHGKPATGEELHRRLREKDTEFRPRSPRKWAFRFMPRTTIVE